MSYHHKSGVQKRTEKAMRAEGVKRQNTLKQHGFAGADTGFSKKAGLRPAIRNAGERCPLQVRYEKRGGWGVGAVHFRPDTKSREGGGGVLPASGPIQQAGGGCCPALQARYKKRGGGGGGAVQQKRVRYLI